MFFVVLISVFSRGQLQKDIGVFKDSDVEKVRVSIGQSVLIAEIAYNNALMERGLGGRAYLQNDEAMIFNFDEPGFYGFWMKDMNFPIDIIWIDANKKIVFVKEGAEPSSFPEVFMSNYPAKFVLEVNAGFCSKNKVKIGDEVNFLNSI